MMKMTIIDDECTTSYIMMFLVNPVYWMKVGHAMTFVI